MRPGLDVIPVGRETPTAEAALAARCAGDPQAVELVGDILAPLADDYDLMLCDCPPATHAPMVEAALVAARFLLIPTFRDEGSLHWLERMADKVSRIRGDGLNPDSSCSGSPCSGSPCSGSCPTSLCPGVRGRPRWS